MDSMMSRSNLTCGNARDYFLNATVYLAKGVNHLDYQ